MSNCGFPQPTLQGIVFLVSYLIKLEGCTSNTTYPNTKSHVKDSINELFILLKKMLRSMVFYKTLFSSKLVNLQ